MTPRERAAALRDALQKAADQEGSDTWESWDAKWLDAVEAAFADVEKGVDAKVEEAVAKDLEVRLAKLDLKKGDVLVVELAHRASPQDMQRVVDDLGVKFFPLGIQVLVCDPEVGTATVRGLVELELKEARQLVKDIAHLAHRTETIQVAVDVEGDGGLMKTYEQRTVHAKDCPGCEAMCTNEWVERIDNFIGRQA